MTITLENHRISNITCEWIWYHLSGVNSFLASLKSTARMPESTLVDKKKRQYHPIMTILYVPLDIPHMPWNGWTKWTIITLDHHRISQTTCECIWYHCEYSRSNYEIRQYFMVIILVGSRSNAVRILLLMTTYSCLSFHPISTLHLPIPIWVE